VLVGEAGGRRAAAALIALVCALAAPTAACADEFTVDSTADEPAVAGVCASAAGDCTLRAAIEVANDSEGSDTISFAEEIFDGQAAGTVALDSSLEILGGLRIDGLCSTAAEVIRPCVGIDGPGPGDPALFVHNAEEVEVEGVAVTGAETGIRVEGSRRFRVRGSWLGVRLDGSLAGNGTGIFLDPESNGSRIGGEGPEARNVFAGNVGDGLDVFGTSNVRVLGNYFGVLPDGSTAATNGKDVEVTSDAGGGVAATGNSIGTRVSRKAVDTPECDGGCNVISGSASNGVDLEGDGGDEGPAVTTTVAGNYIGLDAGGSASVPNAGVGVEVGMAPQTIVGGPNAGEANYLSGGTVGIDTGPAATDLVVRGNLIGIATTGIGRPAPPAAGIVVNSEGVAIPALEALVADNEIAMEGGVAIAQQGLGAWIFGNEIVGGETGISVSGYTEEHGNLIEGNSVTGTSGNGILVENEMNEIRGNEIMGAGAAGIRTSGPVPAQRAENLIGGDAAADENLISGSAGAAIEIVDIEASRSEVARNRGAANGGPFIDLVALDPATEPKGPGEGIKPPAFSVLTPIGAAGSDAVPGADVRVFRKAGPAPGELESFLGETKVDPEGNWSLDYGASLPAGTIVAATQTSEGATSELAIATTPVEAQSLAACVLPGGCGGAAPPAPPAKPRTKIFKGSKGKRLTGTTAVFRFTSSAPGSSFRCKLDRAAFERCRSPQVYQGLKPGRHRFQVRAVNSAGVADPTPVKLKFTVLG
jgi:CSLREA domain-containing protein